MMRRSPSAAGAGLIWLTGASLANMGSARLWQDRFAMPADDFASAPPRRIYGRRRGRKLRPGQQRLHERLLPHLAVTLPETGMLDPASLFAGRPDPVWLEIGFGA